MALLLVQAGEDNVENGHRYAHDHLGDLGDSDVHAVEPLRLDLDCHKEVVKIHDGVDAVVHRDKHDPNRVLGHVRMPAIQQDRNVVVPVQKDEGFLVNDDEKSVKELAGKVSLAIN